MRRKVSPCSTLLMSLLNTPNGPAHNPLGAGSQPLMGKLTRSVGLADFMVRVCRMRMVRHDSISAEIDM